MGLTKPRAAQIYNLDYKQSTRVITTTNIILSGGAPNAVDGVNLSLNDRILVIGQSTGSQNGIYRVNVLGTGSNGTWVRTSDTNETGEIEAGMIVMVTEGTIYADTQWKLITNDPITVGTTDLTFVQNYYANSISAGNSNVVVNSNSNITISSAGTANVLTVSNLGALVSGVVSSSGNVTGGNILTAGIVSATGNVTGNYFIGNGACLTGVVTSLANINNGNSNVTVIANSNVTVNIAGTSNVAVFATTGEYIIGVLSASGNVTGGNITTAGLVTATGNITGGNILTVGQVSATGNVIADNVVADNVISTGALTLTTGSNGNINIQPNGTGNIVLSNTYINSVRYPVQDQDAASKIYVDNLVSTAISYHEAVFAATTTTLATTTGGTITYNQPGGAGNGIGATLTTTGSFNLIDTANVQSANTRILVKDEANAAHNGVYVWSNATVITRSTDTNTYGAGNVDALGLNDYFYTTNGNVNKGTAFIVDAPTGTITFGTSNIQFAIFSQSQVYSANTDAGLSLIGTQFNAKVDNNTTAFDIGGNIIVKAGANLTTPNIGAATGTSLSVTGNVTGGNVNTAGLITATGNITGGNILTVGQVSATGNVTGNFFIGNGAFLTGLETGTSNAIANGATRIDIPVTSGNIAMSVAGQSNTVVINLGSFTMYGTFAGPKTLEANVEVADSVNAMLIGPVVVGNGYHINVPSASTLYVYSGI